MRRVWILVVCLTVSSFAAAEDLSQTGVNTQTAAVAKQISSELLDAVQNSNEGHPSCELTDR